jgi:hypothetical protein
MLAMATAAAAAAAAALRGGALRAPSAGARVDPASRWAPLELELARGGGALRRALAAAAGAFVAGRGWERLGFARLSDYAVERLGVSGRELQDLARVDAALASLPRVSEGLVAGRLSWTKARLLARVATSDDELAWLALAKALPARALAREVRRLDVGSLERGGARARAPDDDDEEERPRETERLRCTPRVRVKWHRVRLLAHCVAGQRLVAWQCAEAVAAEVLSALPLDAVDVPREVAGPGFEVGLGAAGTSPRPVRRTPSARGTGRGHEAGCDVFALDARLRALVAREQRAEAELAAALLAAFEARRHRARGFPSFEGYVRDALGLSPRRARMLLRLARAVARVPALGEAWGSGRLSFLRAYAIAPLLVAGPRHARAWIERARAVPCVQVEEEAAAALVRAEVDPEGFAACGGLPVGAGARAVVEEKQRAEVERQAGAQPTVVGEGVAASAETARLLIQGPRDVMRLLRAVLCTVRRHLERRTGRCPTPGEALEAMLDHALAEWQPRRTRRERRAQRIYERDGWRCTVPGCTSYRNLQDHHVVFRARGGSNAPANRTTLCAWHHLRGVHAGRVRCTGRAPDALRFELGLRPGHPPLVAYG